MQRQHRQLHTQEQILRYQLQQKRRLLSELKDELEYCRRKWAAARAKNDESQEQCDDLRREFAQRKLEDANNSTESGYSDSGPPSDEEERLAAIEVVSAGVAGGCRRKILQEKFEHTRKIKRMQSTSPGRADYTAATANGAELVLRWNSAPPTCGWPGTDAEEEADDDDVDDHDDDDDDDVDDNDNDEDLQGLPGTSSAINRGAVPKRAGHTSRSRKRHGVTQEAELVSACMQPEEHASRIQRLEEQCKSLIQQVLETSDNRERLEIQLCRFQDDIAPVQYAVPLDGKSHKKRLERMERASSAPAPGCLTPREEEYTRKRSERLGRLEEESRQLLSRIKRTSDRGHYLRCSLDRIRRAPSREGSFDSNTEDEVPTKLAEKQSEVEPEAIVALEPEANENKDEIAASPLTTTEEAYTARRAARLQRLEEESKELLQRLSRKNQRGGTLSNRLDAVHERYVSNEEVGENAETSVEQRIDDIGRIAENRQERLRILEEEGKELLNRLSNTSERGSRMIGRIAERQRLSQQRAIASETNEMTPAEVAVNMADDSKERAIWTESAEETEISGTQASIACSSIASGELSETLVVTMTASQIAAEQGAIPKTSRPAAQLSVTRSRVAKLRACGTQSSESLEDMVNRLRVTPFPADSQDHTQTEQTQDQADSENKEEHAKPAD